MSAKVGDVIVTCPGCGTSFQMPVNLVSARVYHHSVVAEFHSGEADHDCKGRD